MTTKPQPGEYWQHKECGDRAYIIGRTPDGELVWQCKGDAVAYGNEDWSEWQHLPECTGWEWQPETFPQYWTTVDEDSSTVAFIVRHGPESYGDWYCVTKDGVKGLLLDGCKWRSEGRTQLTKDQAEALLEDPAYKSLEGTKVGTVKISPVESPDDWVEITDPNHVRRECDWVAGKTDYPSEWNQCSMSVGVSQAAYPMSKVRCRRKNLPRADSHPTNQQLFEMVVNLQSTMAKISTRLRIVESLVKHE